MGDSAALDVEGTGGRPVDMDGITLEHDRVVARPCEGERCREPRDATSGYDELHMLKVPSPPGVYVLAAPGRTPPGRLLG